ncbi:MAG TPA: transglycosylase domain-containing protein [Solimonas sp.]|nr:transglycosylase domain-containing protein [Solimonas sp.]
MSPSPLAGEGRGEGGARLAGRAVSISLIAATGLALATALSLQAPPDSLEIGNAGQTLRITDRSGRALTAAYIGERWNIHDTLPLERIPQFLREAFVLAEDRRYWQHDGVDWRARFAALEQNLEAGETVRGASTIAEQAVRLLHPRPRTPWSRWLEGFEARALERRFGKPAVLEFYLNQVPYGANRRGVAQAAQHYFGRSVETLAPHEMLALAVLVRAPSRLDPRRDPQALGRRVHWLAELARQSGLLDADTLAAVLREPIRPVESVDAGIGAAHFLRELRRRAAGQAGTLQASLDAGLQGEVQQLLDYRVQDLGRRGVNNGAVLVVDLQGRKVRAWAVADAQHPAELGFDAVQTPRQPGSTLKPLLYAMALERGWTAATAINDADLYERVGHGLHQYRNYSGQHYGWITLREALGNSLNIPALKALQFVGGADFLDRLRALGVHSLKLHPDVYGDGLALGNGELSLYELVQAYCALADRGRFQPLSLVEAPEADKASAVMPPDVASLVTDVLADERSRLLEFGDGGALRYPVQTAVKTGTSSDYRDAWTVAYNHRYVVGAWLGNLRAREMDSVTGSVGPALLVRSVFAALNRSTPAEPLYRDPTLVAREVCAPATAGEGCARYREWFRPGTAPQALSEPPPPLSPRFTQPFDGLQLALDPRVPDEHEKLEFRFAWAGTPTQVRWLVDGTAQAQTAEANWLWPLQRGRHVALAEVTDSAGEVLRTPEVRFEVR